MAATSMSNGANAACMNLKKAHATATVSGTLTVQSFPGPPNYESVAKGDEEEKALILKLAKPTCADDGETIDGSTKFARVHVSSHVPALLDVLNAAVGRHVTVHGEAFGAETGHHHAPLVLFADEVAVR
jgi:hypothetical protein